jgi:hypothetical protein
MNPVARGFRQPLCRLWWLDPRWLFATVVGGTMLLAALQSDAAYRLYGAPKYLEAKHVLFTVAAIAAFMLGQQLGEVTGAVPRPKRGATHVVRFWFWLTTGLTLFGYLVWLAVGLRNGFSVQTLREFLHTDDPSLGETIRGEMFTNVKGVTTCTQFGVAAVPLGLWLWFRGERGVVAPLVLLFALAAGRALVFSERLALLELAVPAVVIVLRQRLLGRPATPAARWGWQLAPLAAVVGLVLFFGVFESFRSWRYYRDEFNSYTEFTLWRIGGYYTTAHNNGAMAIETQRPFPIPFATLRPLWSIPGLQATPLAYARLTGVDPAERHLRMLERYGTPELNNEGGLFQPALDFGLSGLVLFWFAYGLVAGRLYRHFLVGTLAGLTMFPLLFLSILEAPRLLYLFYPRSLPAVVALVAVIWLTRAYVGRANRPKMCDATSSEGCHARSS